MRIVKKDFDGHEVWINAGQFVVPYEYATIDEIKRIDKRPLILGTFRGFQQLGTKVESLAIPQMDFAKPFSHDQLKKFRYIRKKNSDLTAVVEELQATHTERMWSEVKEKMEQFKVTRSEFESIREFKAERALLIMLYLKGEKIASDLSLIRGERMYGVCCNWKETPELKKRGLGKYCILKATDYARESGIFIYDMGSGVYPYKLEMANRIEDGYGIALIDDEHPLVKKGMFQTGRNVLQEPDME